MLSEDNLTVAEVSYKVGISDPFYFSKCFKAQFGVAPSVYQRGVNNEGINEKMSDKDSKRNGMKRRDFVCLVS